MKFPPLLYTMVAWGGVEVAGGDFCPEGSAGWALHSTVAMLVCFFVQTRAYCQVPTSAVCGG